MDQQEDTPEAGYERWESLLKVWRPKSRSIGAMLRKVRYRFYFTYLTYAPAACRMGTKINWVERLHRDDRQVLKMRGALPA